MMRRSVRIVVLLLTVAITAGVVWRATINEQARGRMRAAAHQTDASAADAIFELIDLKASLHAYVAPGQGEAFWSSRAESQLSSVRARLRDLEPAAAAAGHPLTSAAEGLDALAATSKRARSAVQDGQNLVAGDMIFTEARDFIDAVVRDISDLRQAMARATSAQEVAMANEQSLLAGGLMAAWIFALILLLPVPAVAAERITEASELPDSGGLQLQLRGDHPVGAAAQDEPAVAARAPAAPAALVAPIAAAGPESIETPVTVPDLTPLVRSLADLCADIGRVSDAAELSPLLERAADVIGARGIVVWLASSNGQELTPAVAHGYDERVLARLGAIAVGDRNVTAEAFRTQETSSTPSDGEVPGAVAVPLLSASGASGVLAAELPAGTDLGRAAAVSGVIAAQLASLFPAVDSAEAADYVEGKERAGYADYSDRLGTTK